MKWIVTECKKRVTADGAIAHNLYDGYGQVHRQDVPYSAITDLLDGLVIPSDVVLEVYESIGDSTELTGTEWLAIRERIRQFDAGKT